MAAENRTKDEILAAGLRRLYGSEEEQILEELFPRLGWSWFSCVKRDALRPHMAVLFLEGVSGHAGMTKRLFPEPELLASRLRANSPSEKEDWRGYPEYISARNEFHIACDLARIVLHVMSDYNVKFQESSQHAPLEEKVAKTRSLLEALGGMDLISAYLEGVPADDLCQ